MKKTGLLLTILTFTFAANSQDIRSVKNFNKVMVGPHVELVLEEGEKETVELINKDVEDDRINVKVKGNRLMIYLDDAKISTKHVRDEYNDYNWKQPIYKGTKVKAIVTYKKLESISLRGEEEYSVHGELDANKLKIRMYGTGNLEIAAVNSRKLKTSLYGENNIIIREGILDKQKYLSYGENTIDTRKIISQVIKTVNYGENELRVAASEKIKFSSLGVSDLEYSGVSRVKRGLTIGENSTYRRKK